jgi:hypothetical protein
MNPFTCFVASSRAQITSTSPKVALPIHFFCPSSTHVSPSRRHTVVSPRATPLPTSGSVSPKPPITSQRRSRGSHSAFCSSLPCMAIDPMHSPACTP